MARMAGRPPRWQASAAAAAIDHIRTVHSAFLVSSNLRNIARHGPQHDRHDGYQAGVEQPLYSRTSGLTDSLEQPEAGVDTLRRDERLVPDAPPPDE